MKKKIKKPEYTKEDLKKLVEHIMNMKQSLQDQNKGEIWSKLETLSLYLKATYYDPMLFEDWLDAEGTFADVLLYVREDLPLLVQGDNELRDILVQWRLSSCTK